MDSPPDSVMATKLKFLMILSGTLKDPDVAVVDQKAEERAKALEKVTEAVNDLRDHKGVKAIAAELDKADKALLAAKTAANHDAAMEVIAKVRALCTDWEVVANAAMRLDLATENLAKLRNHEGRVAVQAEIEGAEKKRDKALELIKGRSFRAGMAYAREIIRDLDVALDVAKACVPYLKKLGEAEPRVNGLDSLPGKDGAAAEIQLAKKTLESAKASGANDARRYDEAVALLKDVIAQVDVATNTAKASVQYQEARNIAVLQAKTLGEHPQRAVIATEIMEAITLVKSAEQLAASSSGYTKAKALLDLVPPKCAAAAKVADGHVPFADLAGNVTAEAIAKNANAAIDAVARLLDGLDKHPHTDAIEPERNTIRAAVLAAKKAAEEPKLDAVETQLGIAAASCTNANLIASDHGRWHDADQTARERLLQLASRPEEPLLRNDLATVDKARADAADAAKDRKYDKALTALAKVATVTDTLVALADTHAAFTRAHTTTTERWSKLGQQYKDAKFAAVQPHLEGAKLKLDAARVAADTRKHDAAMQGVREAEGLCDAAEAEGGVLAGGGKPNALAANLKKVMDRGGTAAIDDIMARQGNNLDEIALKGMFDARFGIKLNGDKIDLPSVVKIYAILKQAPDAHARNNRRLLRIYYDPTVDDKYPSYDATQAKALLYGIRSKDADTRTLCAPSMTPDVEENCKPVDDEKPRYFDWTTLHELGHAVDDKLGFMRNNRGNAAYGGWQEYGPNTAAVAAIVAKHFKYDPRYVAELLAGGAPDFVPEPPQEVEKQAWELAKSRVDEWFDTVRVAKEIWYDDAKSKAAAIDGVVYHEAYENQWVSYLYAARRQGITGYQFRAPGEWMAELYAAWHSKKLKPTHPAAVWLDKL